MKKFKTLYPHMIHGGDYNPDQWRDYPGILDEDVRLMKLAGINSVSFGIFSWSTLEVNEGEFDFSFFDTVMNKMHENGIKVILATPSGSKPAWMSKKYPEILRVDNKRVRRLHGHRHNHCLTSPVYRENVRIINTMLAERYKDHPALQAWHVSNEYAGECHCDLCQQAFRQWLKKKYHNDINELNHQWWSAFWSHTFNDFDEIESPSDIGENDVHALVVDWRRFTTEQTIDFYMAECEPLRRLTPNIPITTNFHGINHETLDYQKFKDYVDFVCWDAYPDWHNPTGNEYIAANIGFIYDMCRSFKGGQPFLLMESTPSLVNWKQYNNLKKPGMHKLACMQAIAHGSDSIQYFQWRKSRGSAEKFHGAVVDHVGNENTRVFGEVAEVGKILKSLDSIVGTSTKNDVAIVYDWENEWMLREVYGFRRDDKKYMQTVLKHYYSFWKNGVGTDVIDLSHDIDSYKILVLPMQYMMKDSYIEKIKNYVKNGGCVVMTYMSGYANENDLCYLGGFPAGELKDVFGIWNEEIDTLFEENRNKAEICTDGFGKKSYEITDYCEIIHTDTAETLALYGQDFYKGMPCLTRNSYGKGSAYYIAFRDNGDFLCDFYSKLIDELQPKKALDCELVCGVSAQAREDEDTKYIFISNFNSEKVSVKLKEDGLKDYFTGDAADKKLELEPYGFKIFTKEI